MDGCRSGGVALALVSALWTGALTTAATPAAGQSVLLEGAVRAGGLWCFPLASDADAYLYLPDRASLATDDQDRPRFSLIRYVVGGETQDSQNESLIQARGGGILTFLVSYGVSDERRAEAARELPRVSGNPAAVLRGPVIFTSGRYTLVSSILGGERGGAERTVLAAGQAPVLEGNRIALSFELDGERSTLLLESLKTATPDVSLVFDMTFAGLSPSFDAELVVDWEKVAQHRTFRAGGTVFWVGAEVEQAFEEMRLDNAIELRSRGRDEAMEALLQTVYSRLTDLMFEPVSPRDVPEAERGGLMDAIAKLVEPEALAELAGKTTGFGLSAGYRAKGIRSAGTSVLTFDHQAALERHATIAFNIGNLWADWGGSEAYFRTVDLGDPAFEQRVIRVGVDGSLLPELERFVNSVTVTLEKRHEDGRVTLREIVLDARSFAEESPDLRLVYGWSGDDDRNRWLEYRYRTAWSFRDGGRLETDWTTTTGGMIDLYVPYRRRPVALIGDLAALRGDGVRAMVVEIAYPFFGDTLRQRELIRLDRTDPEDPPPDAIEVTLPLDQSTYEYRITWHLAGGTTRTTSGTDGEGVLFIDQVPEPSPDAK